MRISSLLRNPSLMPLRGRGSLRAQLVWLTAVASTVTVLLLGALVQWLLATTTESTVDAALSRNAADIAASAVQASRGSTITVPQTRLDAGVAVYDDSTGHVVAGAVPEALEEQYERVRTQRGSRTLRVSDYARVHALGFTTRSGTRGTVVVSERLAPYQDTDNFALWVTLGAGLLLIGATTGLVAFASKRVLAPVGDMARTADDWSEHDLTRRFELGEPDNEITALGHTLDGLLDKVAATIRSEQRLTSELAHELRTPLTAVQGTAELLRSNPSLDHAARADLAEITAACRRMAHTITGLIELARNSSSVASPASCSITDVVDDVLAELGLSDSGDVEVVTAIPQTSAWAVPHQLAVRAVTPIVSNAARFARQRVRLTTQSLPGGGLSLLVEDDGPGVDLAVRARLFRPGETGGGGAGLGLALSRRIARTNGGDVALDADTDVTTFRLTMPTSRGTVPRRS